MKDFDATSPEAAVEGRVVVGSHSGLIVCVDLSTGAEVWAVQLGGRVESSCARSACGHFVVVGCYDSNLYTLDLNTGAIVWTFGAGAEIKSSPCISGSLGDVIFGCHDGCVYCVNILSQSLVWSRKTTAEIIFSSPAASAETKSACVGTLGGDLLSISTESTNQGQLRWTTSLGKPLFSSPAVWKPSTLESPEMVYIGCVDGSVSCFDNGSGQQQWKVFTTKPVFSSPCVETTTGRILIGSHDGCVYCLHPQTGSILWRSSLGSPVYSSPFVVTFPLIAHGETGGVVFVANTKGLVCALDFVSGRLLASVLLPGEVFSSPVCYPVSDGGCLVLIGCRDNFLYCLKWS